MDENDATVLVSSSVPVKNKKRLLLHICCAPCVVGIWKRLETDYDVTGFFYNPNIHPPTEYEFRKKEITRIAADFNWDLVIPPYEMRGWFDSIRGHEKEPERGERCSLCFEFRFRRVFEYAGENHFDCVGSTLSISPYKSTPQINEAGKRLEDEYGIEFLPENFKKQDGFNRGKQMAMDLGIQHQNYCGCVYSLVDRKLRTR